jgi:hypothetical protein
LQGEDVTDKPVIFISYSHNDEPEEARTGEEKWLTFVQRFLRPAVKDGRFEVWVDRHMPGGADWDPEIEKQLRECDVFVLLVSAYSMASDYVIGKEIAIIRERQANGEDVHFYPIVLTPTPWAGLNKVTDKNLRPRDGEPLSRVSDRLQAMSDIADEIAEIVERLAKEKAVATPKKPKANASIKMEIGGLPETPYVNLVGRDEQLNQLDAAWHNEHINVVSLVAEGGAGKSSLLNEWLTRLQTRGYAGAEIVLGWSFYSQGSKERATSAEGFLNWAVNQLDVKPSSNTSPAKAAAIAETLASRRILLALDGVEPLQRGPGPELGKLKDLGLHELLRRVAANPPSSCTGLIVITTRTAVIDIDRWRKTSAPVIELDQLSHVAGVELLKDNGVWGTAAQLKEAVAAFDGHALALSLVAGFLKETQNGDVRRRDHIRQIAYDDDDPRHAHAKRVIKSYADEWLVNQPILDSIMSLVGLFDRPADVGCLDSLRCNPAINGLTGSIVGLGDENWNKAVARLRAGKLLLPPDPNMPAALDAHPLVREWFGERLKENNKDACREAHGRLYEHLRDRTKESDAPTLEELGPLYQAIAHGCRAGRHEEALRQVYMERVCRRRSNGDLEYYAVQKLGAFSSDLAAISWFFEVPYERPVHTLKAVDRSWVLGQASYFLRMQGRFGEALPPLRAGLRMVDAQQNWGNAAIGAANLCQVEFTLGEISPSAVTARRAIEYADRTENSFRMIATRAAYAHILHSMGKDSDARRLFAKAERLQRQSEPRYPLLYSLRGYRYCDFLLDKGDYKATSTRAKKLSRWTTDEFPLGDRALMRLITGRCALGLALVAFRPVVASRDQVRVGHLAIEQAIEGLRASGQSEDIPRGLLARAAFRRSIAEWMGAARDVDEVEEIAEPGPMKLVLCDMALERARLAFAQIEAFAPLNGMLEKDNPPKPEVQSAEEIGKLKGEAEKQIKIAGDYIQTCGYHRRDEELAELKEVLAGKKMFASLPPRV